MSGHSEVVRVLKAQRKKLERKRDAIRGDLAEAERASQYRRSGQALLSYLHLVPPRATQVAISTVVPVRLMRSRRRPVRIIPP